MMTEEIGDDFIAATVFDPEDGMGIAHKIGEHGFDTEKLNAYMSEYIKEVGKTLVAMHQPPHVVEYLLTANADFMILIRGISGTKYFESVVITKEGNLGLSREILKKHENQLAQELKKL